MSQGSIFFSEQKHMYLTENTSREMHLKLCQILGLKETPWNRRKELSQQVQGILLAILELNALINR